MVPAIVAQAAAVAERDRVGAIVYRIHQTTAMDGGPLHRRAEVVIEAAADGPNLVKVRVLRFLADGTEQSDAKKRDLGRQLLDGQAKGGFAVPFDSRHTAEYAYTAGAGTVQFVSLRRDADHGDGAFTVDAAGHVTGMRYVPDVFPKFVSSGSVTDARAEVLPGFWATVRNDQEYDGQYLFIKGHASVVTEMSGYRRYGSRAAAEAAVEAATL